MDALLDCIRRHTDLQAPGSVETAIPGLILVCATTPSEVKHSLERPVVCLVRQGSKRVAYGTRELEFAAGDSLVVTADVPATSRIVRASAAEPYYAVAVLLDPALIADLGAEMGTPPETALPRDRKSTRLNSSHVKISYAVFCLKKKINTKNPSLTTKRKYK